MLKDGSVQLTKCGLSTAHSFCVVIIPDMAPELPIRSWFGLRPCMVYLQDCKHVKDTRNRAGFTGGYYKLNKTW